MEIVRGPVRHRAMGVALAIFLITSHGRANENVDESTPGDQRVILDPPEVNLDEIAEPRRRSGWHLGVEAVTDVPINVGGQLSLEMPGGLRISSSLGVLPRGYLDVVNSVIVAADGYDETTATLVSNALDNAFVFRVHAGWRPSRARGFYMELGYGMVTIDGGVSSTDMITAVTGQSLPARIPGDLEFAIDSTLHMVDVEIGWELILVDHLVLRFAVGAALTVGAETQITPDDALQDLPSIDDYTQQASIMLNSVYTDYVFTPTVSVALGYRIF